jgi:hypothetical protein
MFTRTNLEHEWNGTSVEQHKREKTNSILGDHRMSDFEKNVSKFIIKI